MYPGMIEMAIRNVFLILLGVMMILPVMALDQTGQQNQSASDLNTAGALYSQSVDLANAGKYQEALQASDRALALNVTALVPLIQANRAGILVMLGRYEEANTAADAALAQEGNLTTTHSIAWYNKGNALRALGRIPEARAAYDQAYALDNSLVPPDMTADTATPAASARSPLPWFTVPAGIGLFIGMRNYRRKPQN
jgi:tetratricopeptide (TPR) repeat protein